MKIDIKLLDKDAKVPTNGSELAAGYDLYANVKELTTIPSHETVKIPTGIAMKIPNGHVGLVFPRSGIATKQGLRLSNCVAVIDADYTGEWFIPIYNDSDKPRVISPLDRIAQVVFVKHDTTYFNIVDKLTATERGGNGFGSTGIN